MIKTPFVAGAVIDMGLCLNLLDRTALAEAEEAYQFFEKINAVTRTPMPENKGPDRAARFTPLNDVPVDGSACQPYKL